MVTSSSALALPDLRSCASRPPIGLNWHLGFSLPATLLLVFLMSRTEPLLARLFTWIKAKIKKPSLQDQYLHLELASTPQDEGASISEVASAPEDVSLYQGVDTEMLPQCDIIARLNEAKNSYTEWGRSCNWKLNINDRYQTDTPFVLIAEAYKMFACARPTHLGVNRSAVHYEEEVIAMTASLFSPNEVRREVCGSFTSGALESILLMVRASCSYLQEKKGMVIEKPEMIVPDSSIDEVYEQVAAYLDVTMFRVPLDEEFKTDVNSVRQLITQNTVLIVGSARNFYNGIIDPIKELAELASRFKICFHVHVSVGGILLPFGAKLKYPSGSVDFSIEGVTSLAIDLDTDGLAPRGTGVILYRNRKIKKHQFVVTEWSGGLYYSPTMIDGKNWGHVVGAWASMQSLGEEGYESYMRMVFDAASHIRDEIEQIPELYIIGKPSMAIIYGVCG